MKSTLLCLTLLFAEGLSVPSMLSKGFLRSAIPIEDRKNYGILGGQVTKINNYPFVVSMTYDPENYLIGSGAILNKHWIVCSAFQVADFVPANISVRVGSNEAESGGQNFSVSKIIIHEDYTADYAYDVALLKTYGVIKLGKTVRPIKLAKSTPKEGATAKIVGYGVYSNQSFVSGQLQVASVQVKSESFCKSKHGDLGDTSFCADANDVGPCYSDFGDPLVRNNQLLGCYLGGDICNLYDLPEIYSNIPKLRKWILTKIKQNSNVNEMQGIDGIIL